ncbi:S9 family peptidase [Actinoalloteichus caeruleus]|uniref:S9 family peptidase n=2 Tax=Actinoalloteichus cyanogriseus TaxID=2893586 RepID=UPI0004C0B693|nr:S9 family peptidase [Actinoalloteichus caeruleus]
MRPDDLYRLRSARGVTLREDLLIVATVRPDREENSYLGGLHRLPLDGGPLTPWTESERDQAASISPDGRWIAFLRSGDPSTRGWEKAPQLYVMPVGGGEPRRLTQAPLGAGAPVWSPDSTRLAFTARVPEPGRYGTDEDVAPDEEAPRRITTFQYRLDNVGFVLDRRHRLFTVDVEDRAAEAREVAGGDSFDVRDPAWTPDGRRLVFAAQRDLNARDTLHHDLYLVPAEGGEPQLAVRSKGNVHLPVVGEDGGVHYYGTEFQGFDSVARNTGLWYAELPAAGEVSAPTRLTDRETVDVQGLRPAVPTSEGLLVAVRVQGSVQLRLVPPDPAPTPLEGLRLVGDPEQVVTDFDHCPASGLVAAVVSTTERPGEVAVLRLTEDAPEPQRVLTDLGAGIGESGLAAVEELRGTGEDGYPLHGWLVLPEGPGPHPVLLVIHGGPFQHYTWGFFDEAQVYASAGYAVVLPNPRGSAGYGESHGRAVVGAMGTVDAVDLLGLLDLALARPELDERRVGVMGGSYGGFMTGWLAAHHGERFTAAWSERAVNAWDSFHGSSDIGWMFTHGYIGTDPVVWREKSPLHHADRITMPFAVVHSEQDWRCPLEQAQRMFVTLLAQGTETEFLLFPGEGHELSRSGRPRHRVQRFEAVLDWWGRWLPVTPGGTG